MLSSNVIQTVWMVQEEAGTSLPAIELAAQVKIFIGDTPATDPDYATLNTLCYTGGIQGVAVCDLALTGQYIIIQQQGTAKM